MAKEAGNKMMGDTLSNIAATDQARKSHVDDMHRKAEMQFAQMDMNREMNRANAITEAAQGASNAIMSVAGAIDGAGSAKTAKGTPITGAGNNSKVVSPNVVSPNAITQAATGSGERYNAEFKVPDMGDTVQPTITDAEYEHFRNAVSQ
jgi:hypothetical protein